MSVSRDLIQITLLSLKAHPDDWTFDRFKAMNAKLDIEVWIANSYYGLKIRGPGIGTGEESALFTGWLTPWRRRVMKAVREAAGHDLRRRFAEVYPAEAKRLPPLPALPRSEAC
ncbi:hypothetical protein [Methylobacterium sp. Leaf108]|uniref:hypothetical protein n=1 Tax=Methylobacterium sp. Leaf108 TaxID=1736256 RepID=UPI0006F64540|nr:hypothetical protein [Methylobacterium sp. Leaf108]KQP61038.1 hypothetical protein ASF39_15290 [Methylobacterium sp. Leaf108]